MRADAAGPRTWLLGAIAGWAIVAWALALFGLGARIERLPDDPALAQRLPALPVAGIERLGPITQYSEFSTRSLFSEDRRPKPFTLQPEGEAQQETFKYVLTSVLMTPRLQLAIIQPEGGGESIRLRVGEAPDSAPSYQLLSLTPRGAVFTGPEGEKRLELRVFNGSGGETPTAVSATPATAGAPGSLPSRGATAPAMGVQPAPGKPVPVPGINTVPAAVPSPPPPQPQTSDAQVEEIRKRIEARRAQLREQSQTQPQPQPPPPPPPAPDETQ